MTDSQNRRAIYIGSQEASVKLLLSVMTDDQLNLADELVDHMSSASKEGQRGQPIRVNSADSSRRLLMSVMTETQRKDAEDLAERLAAGANSSNLDHP